MKKLSFVLAAAGLMTLAACQSPEADNVEDAGENAAEMIENQGDALEEMADNATTEAGEDALENAADNAYNQADNVEDMAENKAEAIDEAK